MNRGEIHLARFPLAGRGGVKLRPVLLLTGLVGPVPEVLTAYLSTIIPTPSLPSDILVDATQPEYASTKLAQVSVLRLHKLATIHKRDVIRLVGAFDAAAMSDIETRLRALLNL
jgi:hypothetical protein